MAKDLRVAVIGDASSYSRALRKAAGETEGFGHSLLKLGKYAALGLGAAGVGGALVTLKRGFDELKESQQVAAQTGAVIKSTGSAANVTAKQVDAMASSLSKMSGADDEAIQSGENMLLTFTNVRNQAGKNNDIFNQATKTLTDFAFAMNRGAAPSAEQLTKNSILLGKALNDPIKGITALRRVGVAFTEDQIKTIKALVDSGHAMQAQKLILAELNKEFGGSAKAAGETFPGQLNKLKNAFDETAAQVAAKLLPALTRVLDWINNHWPQITNVMNAVANAVGAAISATAAVIERNWGTIKATFQSAISGIVTVGRALVAFFRTDLGQAIATGGATALAFAGTLALVSKAIRAFTLLTAGIGGGPTAAIFALAAAVAYLGIKTGLLHSPIRLAANDTEKLTADLRDVEKAANDAGDAFGRLADSNLNLASAHLRVKETAHAVLAAQEGLRQASDGTTKTTLAEKQAQDAVARAKLDHRQAVLDLTKAEHESTGAHVEAQKALQSQLPSLEGILQRVRAVGEAHGHASEFIKKAGMDLLATGQQANAAAFQMKNASPAAELAARSMAQLQIAAGTLAAGLGRIPTKKEIIAKAELQGGPVFIAGLKEFIRQAQETGVKVPEWMRQAVKPTKAAVDEIAAAIRGGTTQMLKAGDALGFSIVTGISAGIYAAMPKAVQAGLTAVANVIGAMRSAAEAKSPSKKTMELGKDMVEGLALGMKYLGPTLTHSLMAAFEGSITSVRTIATKGINNVGQLIVAAAKKYGIDAKAALAVAMGEGGIKFGAVGDSGTSFGPFQLHIGGASPFGDPKKAAEFANSVQGITYAIKQMAAAGAAGKTGFDAISAIIRGFERPLDPSASIAKAVAAYKTLGPQIAGAVSSGTDTVKTSVASQLTALVALVKQYAPQIGIEHVRGIIAGLVGKTPDIVAAAKAQMEKVVAAMALVAQTRTDLKSAFQSMAQGALAAFDEVASKWTPPSLRKLTEMQKEDTINSAVKQVADAQAAVDAAVAAQASLTRNEGESDADFAARVEEAKRNVQTAVEAVGAAQRSYEETQLQLRADQEQAAHDKQMAADREHLAAQLGQLETYLAAHPEKYAETQQKILKLLKKYHVPLFNAGQALAQRFADGLDDGIAAVAATARKLAAALDDVVKATGGGGGGGGGNVNPGTAIGGGHGAGVPSSFAGGRASAGSVNVYVAGDVLSEDQLLTKVRTGLNRYATNNAINPLTA